MSFPSALGTGRRWISINGPAPGSCANLPFGDGTACQQNGGSDSPTRFTGAEHDSDAGLDHFRFRQYSSAQGRRLSPDPAGLAAADPANPQTWNRYAYVANQPLAHTDPLGLHPCVGPLATCASPRVGGVGAGGSSGPDWVGGEYALMQVPVIAFVGYFDGYLDGTTVSLFDPASLHLSVSASVGLDYEPIYADVGNAAELTGGEFGGTGGGQPARGPEPARIRPPDPGATQYQPPSRQACASYRANGSGLGDVAYLVCANFPDTPWGDCMRGQLLAQYPEDAANPLWEIEATRYLLLDHPWDAISCIGQRRPQ